MEEKLTIMLDNLLTELENEQYNEKNTKARLEKFTEGKDGITMSDAISFSIGESKGFSTTVLLAFIKQLAKEGYLNTPQ